jgi:hypothetical protein
MREQATTMAASLDLTKRAADAAQASANAANTQAVAAEEANKINRDLLIATQRPWISVDLAPAGALKYRVDLPPAAGPHRGSPAAALCPPAGGIAGCARAIHEFLA